MGKKSQCESESRADVYRVKLPRIYTNPVARVYGPFTSLMPMMTPERKKPMKRKQPTALSGALIQLVRYSPRVASYPKDKLHVLFSRVSEAHLKKIEELADYLNRCHIHLSHPLEVDFFFNADDVERILKILSVFRPDKINHGIWQILLCANFINETCEMVRDALIDAMREWLTILRNRQLAEPKRRKYIARWFENVCEILSVRSITAIVKVLKTPSKEDLPFLLNHFSVGLLEKVVVRLNQRQSFNTRNWEFLKKEMRPEDYSPLFIELDANHSSPIILSDIVKKTREQGTSPTCDMPDLLIISPHNIKMPESRASASPYADMVLALPAISQPLTKNDSFDRSHASLSALAEQQGSPLLPCPATPSFWRKKPKPHFLPSIVAQAKLLK